MYGIHHCEGFLEIVKESWPEWDLNQQPLNFIQML